MPPLPGRLPAAAGGKNLALAQDAMWRGPARSTPKSDLWQDSCCTIPELVEHFGPHAQPRAGRRMDHAGRTGPVVKTIAASAGSSAASSSRSRTRRWSGFEPWEEFPFNRGKLCPKGVKRYMQDEHPDRLLTPLQREAGRGFGPIGWDTALDRVAARSSGSRQTTGATPSPS